MIDAIICWLIGHKIDPKTKKQTWTDFAEYYETACCSRCNKRIVTWQ